MVEKMADFCRISGLSGHAIWETCRCLLLSGGLAVAAWTDLRKQRISNRLLLMLLCSGALCLLLESGMDREWTRILESIGGLLTGGGVCLCCYVLSRGGIGAGDVKLFAVVGFYLGRVRVLQMGMVSVFLAAGACIAMLVSGKADRTTRLPYVPFIFLAAIMVLSGRTGWMF